MQTKNFNSRMSFKNSIYHSVKKMVGLIPKNKDANFLQYSKNRSLHKTLLGDQIWRWIKAEGGVKWKRGPSKKSANSLSMS